jgi:hypothetical protein
MSNRVLVIPTSDIGADEIQATIGDRFGDAEVHVVAPASKISRLDWLTNAEDDARADAAERADEVADALPADDVETRVGDTDPLQAIDDEVRTFHPDEIVVVSRTDDEATWLESDAGEAAQKRFTVPVTHLTIA